jgi:hypothetical protein
MKKRIRREVESNKKKRSRNKKKDKAKKVRTYGRTDTLTLTPNGSKRLGHLEKLIRITDVSCL